MHPFISPSSIKMVTHFLAESPIGVLTLVKTDGVLSGLFMGGLTDARAQIFGPRVGSGFEDVVEQLHEYFARSRTTFTLPIASPERLSRSACGLNW